MAEPLSVTDVRALLGAEADGLTDAEVLALRDEVMEFASLVVRGYQANRRHARLLDPMTALARKGEL